LKYSEAGFLANLSTH